MSLAEKPRVLCFSPYTYWELHGQWETTVLQGVRARGAEVSYVLCDAMMSECDLFWAVTQPRHATACTDCQARTTRLMATARMPFRWLGRWALPADEAEATAWAEGLAVAELEVAAWDGLPLGAWVLSTIHSHFRTAPVELDDPEVVATYRRYLSSARRVAVAFGRLLDDFRPDVLFLFNGRQAPTRVAFELASARGIRVVCHERGGRPEALMLFDGVRCDQHAMTHAVRQAWEPIPLDAVEIRTIEAYMRGRALGKGLGWSVFTKGLEDPAVLRRRLGFDDRPVWVVYTSSDDEVAASEDFRTPFESHSEWLARTLAWAASRNDIQWIIRHHPNMGGQSSTGRNVRQLEEAKAMAESAPPWVRIIMPEDGTSSYALLDLADQVLVYYSTIGVEAGCRGLPVLVGGRPEWSDAAFAAFIKDAAEYEAALDRLAAQGPHLPRHEIRRMALRLAHALYFRFQVDFAPVRMPDAHTGRLAWDSLDAVRPGQDPGLDRVVGILVDGQPVVPRPTRVQENRSTAVEDAWYLDGTWTSPEPAVSVVITCYNYADHVEAAMESVLRQTFQDFELLVIDDGSTDDSLAVAEAVAARWPLHPVKVWTQPNSGQPALARNAAIGVARGKYIACLDADDLLEPHFLAACVAVLEQRPEVGLAYVDLRDIGGPEQRWPGVHWDLATLKRYNFVPCCSLFRREAWEEVGGYRTNVRGYEDWDFWLALAAAGHVGQRIAYPWFRYRRHAGGVYHQVMNQHLRLVAGVRRNNATLFSPQEQREASWWEQLAIRKDGRTPGRVPPLSVVVPLSGDVPDLPLLLAELVESLNEELFELLLVQSGPSASLDELIPDLEGDLVISDEPADVQGGAAFNRALSIARGRWLLWLEVGTAWELGWLMALQETLVSGILPQISPDGPPWLDRADLLGSGGVPDSLSWSELGTWLAAHARRSPRGVISAS